MPLVVTSGGSLRMMSPAAAVRAKAALKEPVRPKRSAGKPKRRRKKRKAPKRKTTKRRTKKRKAKRRTKRKGKRKTSKKRKRKAAAKVHTTARYRRRRIQDPGKFDPRSFRVIDPGRPGHMKLIVACPKGGYRRGRCKVSTEVQAELQEI